MESTWSVRALPFDESGVKKRAARKEKKKKEKCLVSTSRIINLDKRSGGFFDAIVSSRLSEVLVAEP